MDKSPDTPVSAEAIVAKLADGSISQARSTRARGVTARSGTRAAAAGGPPERPTSTANARPRLGAPDGFLFFEAVTATASVRFGSDGGWFGVGRKVIVGKEA